MARTTKQYELNDSKLWNKNTKGNSKRYQNEKKSSQELKEQKRFVSVL